MATPAASNLNIRPRPYRRFLTSAFHSRFVQASFVALLVAFDTTFWVSNKRNLWSWFPIGPAFFKILLLFFTSLYIFILRVATLKIGRTVAQSPLMSLRSKVLTTSAPQTFFWHTVSAMWFSEIFIWTAAESSQLGWTTRGELSMPDRLNERPIYLRTILLCVAMVQSAKDIYYDYSYLHIPVSAPSSPPTKGQTTHPIESVSAQLQKAFTGILWKSIAFTLPWLVLGPLVYTIFLRQKVWWIFLQLAKPFFNISRADARPVGYPPCTPGLLLTTLSASYLLTITWEATTVLFSTYLKQEPLNKGLPLSAGSKDPNGTLVNGLKAKRDVVKTFAFWELAIIGQRFPERRMTIFADIDRPDGPRWSQMLNVALDVIRSISTRIEMPSSKAQPTTAAQHKPAQEPIPLPRLLPDISKKRVLTEPPKPRTTRTQVEAVVSTGFKLIGQSSDTWTPPTQKLGGLIEYLLPPGADPQSSQSLLQLWWIFLSNSPLRWFFEGTTERKVNMLVLGSTCGNAALIADAIEGITKTLVASLSEDRYGKVISGVPDTVRVFTQAISAIENLLNAKGELRETEMEEVRAVVLRLKAGLAELLSAFQLYLSDVGLGIGELNDAKKAAQTKTVQPEAQVESGSSWERDLDLGSRRAMEELPREPIGHDARRRKNDTKGKQRTIEPEPLENRAQRQQGGFGQPKQPLFDADQRNWREHAKAGGRRAM